MNVMKRLFAFSLVLFMVPLGHAAITAHRPDLSALKSSETVSGEVVSVDSDKKEVVVKNTAGSEVRLLVDESTKFTKGSEDISLADLKPGVKVTCETAESEGKLVAKSIQVDDKE